MCTQAGKSGGQCGIRGGLDRGSRLIYHNLLPTGSEDREVLGVGSIPDVILPSCQYWIIRGQV